jgi:hypothetical protein
VILSSAFTKAAKISPSVVSALFVVVPSSSSSSDESFISLLRDESSDGKPVFAKLVEALDDDLAADTSSPIEVKDNQ